MSHIPPDSALHRLADNEICIIVFQDGRKAEALWSVQRRGFHYLEGELARFVSHDEVYEWWPDSVKY